MSTPRIYVRRDSNINHWSWHMWEWTCTACFPCHQTTFGYEHQAHTAADAGRAHLAAHHTAQMPVSTYCRTHGVSRAACQVAHRDPEQLYGVHRCSGESSFALPDALDTAHNEGSRR